MTNKHVETCSTSYIIKELQSTTMRYYYIPISSSVAQSCLTLWGPMDCRPPGSAAHGIFQTKVLKWGAISYTRGVFQTQGLNLHFLHLLHWQTDPLPLSSPDSIFLGSKITEDGDWNHEIKRCLLLGRKSVTNLDNILKSRDITLQTKVCLVKAMVLPVVMYGWESWTIKKAECWRIDAFELWSWKRFLRVLWTARTSN